MEDPPDPPPQKYRLKPKEDFARANDPATDRIPSSDHNVFGLRQHGRVIEQQGGQDEVIPVKRSNRRAKDYWVILIFADLVLGATALLGRQNLFIFASAVAGIVLFTVGLTWIMWSGLIRRY